MGVSKLSFIDISISTYYTFIILHSPWNLITLFERSAPPQEVKDALLDFLVNKQKLCLYSVLLTKMYCVYPRGLTNMFNAFPSSENICKANFKSILNPSNDLLLCICWCPAAFLGTLQPPVVQWDSVKPLAGMCVTCFFVCMHETNETGTLLQRATLQTPVLVCRAYNSTHALHNLQSRQIAVLITLHDCLSYNGASLSCCGLHITRVISEGVTHYKTFYLEESPTSLSGLQTTSQSTKHM